MKGSFQFNNPYDRVELARFLLAEVPLTSMVRKGLLERLLTEPDFNKYRSTHRMGLRMACFPRVRSKFMPRSVSSVMWLCNE